MVEKSLKGQENPLRFAPPTEQLNPSDASKIKRFCRRKSQNRPYDFTRGETPRWGSNVEILTPNLALHTMPHFESLKRYTRCRRNLRTIISPDPCGCLSRLTLQVF